MRAAAFLLALSACGGGGADLDVDAGIDATIDASPPAWTVRDVAGIPNLDDDDENGIVDFEQPPFAADTDRAALALGVTGDVTLALTGEVDGVHVYRDGALVLGGAAGAGPVVLAASGDLAVDFRDLNVRGALAITAAGGESREVALRAAPLVLNHHLQPAEHVWAVRVSSNGALVAALQAALGPAFTSVSGSPYGGDVWIQDELELATVTGQDGERLDIVIDSIRDRGLDPFPERELVGPGVIARTWGERGTQTTYDSFGNLEVSPPVADHPFGRIYYGLTGASGLTEPLRTALAAQQIQAPFAIPTAWLCVGHVDELSSFVPDASSPKGFKLLLADVPSAWTLLRGLDRAAPLGRYGEDHGYPTVGSLLDDADLVALNDQLQADHLAPIAQTFMTQLGLTEADIIRVPSLFEVAGGCGGRVVSLIPGMVNLVVAKPPGTDATHVFTADPYFRAGGAPQSEDPFIADFAARMPDGLTLHYLDDWNTYHLARGEVHCGTNVRRTPTGAWWAKQTPGTVAPAPPPPAETLATMQPVRTRDGRLRLTSPLVHAPGATASLLARITAGTESPAVRAALVEALPRAGGAYLDALARHYARAPAEVRAMIAFVARRGSSAAAKQIRAWAHADLAAVRAELR